MTKREKKKKIDRGIVVSCVLCSLPDPKRGAPAERGIGRDGEGPLRGGARRERGEARHAHGLTGHHRHHSHLFMLGWRELNRACRGNKRYTKSFFLFFFWTHTFAMSRRRTERGEKALLWRQKLKRHTRTPDVQVRRGASHSMGGCSRGSLVDPLFFFSLRRHSADHFPIFFDGVPAASFAAFAERKPRWHADSLPCGEKGPSRTKVVL